MRSMVRVLVGTMLEVGTGRRTQADFGGLLRGAPRKAAGETAPPTASTWRRSSTELRRGSVPGRLHTIEAMAEQGPAHQRRRDRRAGAPGPAARRPGRSMASTPSVIAPDSNRSATARSITTRSPLWVEEVAVRRRPPRLRDRRHAGRLRSLRRPRSARRASRPDRLGHQPRLQPRRRRHLLGHGRRGARGDRARDPGDRRLAAVVEAGRWTSALRCALSTSTVARRLCAPSWSPACASARCPRAP